MHAASASLRPPQLSRAQPQVHAQAASLSPSRRSPNSHQPILPLNAPRHDDTAQTVSRRQDPRTIPHFHPLCIIPSLLPVCSQHSIQGAITIPGHYTTLHCNKSFLTLPSHPSIQRRYTFFFIVFAMGTGIEDISCRVPCHGTEPPSRHVEIWGSGTLVKAQKQTTPSEKGGGRAGASDDLTSILFK